MFAPLTSLSRTTGPYAPQHSAAKPATREPPPALGRRAVLKGAAAGAAGVTGWTVVGGTPAADAAIRPMAARSAESVADAFGVVVHFHFQRSVYRSEQAVVEKMVQLGARHARSRLVPRMAAVRHGFTRLADAGCRINGVCQAFNDRSQPSVDDLMQEVRDYYDGDAGGVFSSFEGINEPNNDGIPWVAETRARTQALWQAATSHPKTAGIPIIGPALADTWTLRQDYRQLGDLTQWTDLGSIHIYPRGITPSTLIDAHKGYARASYGTQSFVCTEGGYNNALRYHRLRPVPEDVAGDYGPRHLLEHYIRGNRFFRYELLDDVDPSKRDWESHFGLVGVRSMDPSSWRDKSAFSSMRHLLRIIGDRGGLSFQTTPLSISVTGGGSDLRKVLVQKRNGTYYLILWRDVTIYDPARHRYVDVRPDVINVSLQRRARLKIYSPSRRQQAVRDLRISDRAHVWVSGRLKLLEITPT